MAMAKSTRMNLLGMIRELGHFCARAIYESVFCTWLLMYNPSIQ